MTVSLEEKSVTLVLDKSAGLSDEAIRELVKDAGYDATKVEHTPAPAH